MTTDCLQLPPGPTYHFKNAPSMYVWFWIICAVGFVIIFTIIVPTLIRIYSKAVVVRDSVNEILLPSSYKFILIIVGFPLLICASKFLILLSPVSVFIMEFICHAYEGITLYCFSRLLIMFLGTHKVAIEILEQSDPVKFWAVPPYGCCFRPCCKPMKFAKSDFRIIYFMILQYTILSPLISFLDLIGGILEDPKYIAAVKVINFFSSFTCIYALFALLRVSTSALHSYKAHGKFFTIKGAVLCVIIPQAIMQFIHVSTYSNGRYSHEVIREAYSAFITIVILTPLSYYFVKYFTVEDCETARVTPLEKRKFLILQTLSKEELSQYETGMDSQMNTENKSQTQTEMTPR